MTDAAIAIDPPVLTSHVALRRVEVLINPRSGGVGPRATAECEAICAQFAGIDWNLIEADPARLDEQVTDALGRKPDLMMVIAGDGTARAAASQAGADGPLIAPLPGGTMNMLPKALYGTTDWKAAMMLALTEGASRPVPGGEVDGRAFYCAAIFGAPALWAPAREAVRSGVPRLAWLYARRALGRAFAGNRIRYHLDDGPQGKAEALALITPLISRALESPDGLEAAAMNLTHATEAFRLAARALFTDWRSDPSVETEVVRRVSLRARSRIPAILDGESVQLPREVEAKFLSCAFKALAPKTANPAIPLGEPSL